MAKTLRDLRTDAGLTQAGAGSRAGISTPKISDMERAKFEPTIRTIRKLARAYQTDPMTVFRAVLETAAAAKTATHSRPA